RAQPEREGTSRPPARRSRAAGSPIHEPPRDGVAWLRDDRGRSRVRRAQGARCGERGLPRIPGYAPSRIPGGEFPPATGVTMRMLPILALLAAWTVGAEEPAHFHHLHLNSTDPAAAIDFYTARLESEKRKFAGIQDAVWAHGSWLLFTRVD